MLKKIAPNVTASPAHPDTGTTISASRNSSRICGGDSTSSRLGPVEGKMAAILVGALGLVACGPAVGLGSSGNDDGTSGGAGGSTGTPPIETTSGGESTAATASETGGKPETGSTSTGSTPVGPDEVLEGCEGDRYRAGLETGTPVHVISVHEPGQAEFDVEWSIPGDGVLVLSSYASVRWRVTLVGDGSLSRIVANGLQEFTVDAPDGVEVELIPEPDVFLLASRYPSLDGERVRLRVEHLLNRPVTGMDFCYDDATAAVITPHNALGAAEPPIATGCERLLGARDLCVLSLISVGRYSVVNPSSGELCTVNEHDAYFGDPPRGWGVNGQLHGYVCSYSPYVADTTVAEVELETGIARWSDVPCQRVYTGSWGEILVYLDGGVRVFDDFAALLGGFPLVEYEVGEIDELAADGETLYQLTNGDTVHRWNLHSGFYVDSIPIGPIGTHDAFAALDGRLLARESGTLHVFDNETGEPLESLEIGTAWPGEMSCFNRPPI